MDMDTEQTITRMSLTTLLIQSIGLQIRTNTTYPLSLITLLKKTVMMMVSLPYPKIDTVLHEVVLKKMAFRYPTTYQTITSRTSRGPQTIRLTITNERPMMDVKIPCLLILTSFLPI